MNIETELFVKVKNVPEDEDDLYWHDLGGGGDAPADSPVRRSTQASRPNAPSNIPSRRPGPLLSRGAKLVAMARESQIKEKESAPPQPESEQNGVVLNGRREYGLRSNPATDSSDSPPRRHNPRRLMRPDVHLPEKVKDESKPNKEGNGIRKAKQEAMQATGTSETGGKEGKKRKRPKKETVKVDLLSRSPNSKKLKEIK